MNEEDDALARTVASAAATGGTVADTVAANTVPDAGARPSSSAFASAPSSTFVLERELARGGMGRVVVASDRRLDRTVALKLLQRDSPAMRARFEREAGITARLGHPAIVPIYEAGVLGNGEPFYAMKLVEGTPLDATIASAPDLRARLALLPRAMAVCEALAYAHSKQVIHRDLKPANVLVGAYGETVVIDWGIAKDLSRTDTMASLAPESIGGVTGDSLVTVDGEVVGTPSYMPPEQAAGGTVDARADVYALGALLYHVVAGKPPYRGRNAGEILAAVEAGPPPPIAELVPDVPDDLASIIGKAMARRPDDRYPSAGGLADELRRFIDGRLVESHRYSGAELLKRWLRKHRAAVAVAAVAIAVLAIGAVVSVRKIVARERETAAALAESELEQGRQLLASGDFGQAMPYLAAALTAMPDDPVARRLASTAVRDVDRKLASFRGTVSAFRPDGRELAVADGSKLDVRDPDTGAPVRTLSPDAGDIASLDYSPDGKRLAIATDRGAFVIDAATGARVATASTTPAKEIRFVPPRGELVAILGARSVALASATDGKLVASDATLDETYDEFAVAPDGSAVAANCKGAAIAWSVPELARIATAPDGGADRYSILVDRDALITAGGDGVKRWLASATGEPATLSKSFSVALARMPDGSLISGGEAIRDGAPRVFSHATIQASATVDATHAITGGYDRVLRVWDLARTDRPAIVLDANGAVLSIVVDPAGRRAVSRSRRDNEPLELWDLSNVAAPIKTATVGHRIDWIVSDQRDRIAVRTEDATHILNAALEPVAVVPGWPVAFRPGTEELITDDAGRLETFAAATGVHMREIADQPHIWHVGVSTDGRAIATASEHHVALRDADWAIVASFDTPDALGEITAVDVDDGRVVTGHASGAVTVWDPRTGKRLAAPAGHTANVTHVEVRGDELVTSSWDMTTRRWALPSGRPLAVIKRFDQIENGLAISPTAPLLATAGVDATVDLWDMTRGGLIDRLATVDQVAAVAFVGADRVVAGGAGGHLELFELATPRPTAEILRRAAKDPRWRLEHGRAVEVEREHARTP